MIYVLSRFSCVQLSATQWTLAHQTPLSIRFSSQEYWSGLPFPSLGHGVAKSRTRLSDWSDLIWCLIQIYYCLNIWCFPDLSRWSWWAIWPNMCCIYVLNHSVVSGSLQPHGLQLTRLLRPWNFPGKSTGVGCHSYRLSITVPSKFRCWNLIPNVIVFGGGAFGK